MGALSIILKPGTLLHLLPSVLKASVREPQLQPLLGDRKVSLDFSRDLRVASCFFLFISIQVTIEKFTPKPLI